MSEERAIARIEQKPVDLQKETEHLSQKLLAKWPKDVNKAGAMEIARIALAYELDPFLGELIPYQGNPYVTIDGRIRIADRHPAYDGFQWLGIEPWELESLKPAKEEVIWKCAVYRKDRRFPIVAYGRANGPQDRNPLSKNDAVTMAQKRALHRALRAAFPIPIPGLEESLSYEQIKAIHTLDKAAGVGDEARHEVLGAQFGVESSKELTKEQASVYIEGRVIEVEGKAVDEDQPEEEPATPAAKLDVLTDDQVTTLVNYAASLGIDREALDNQARELFKAPVAFITKTQGRKLYRWVADQELAKAGEAVE
jgi:hypothetical protein